MLRLDTEEGNIRAEDECTYVENIPFAFASSPALYEAFVSVCIGSPSSASQRSNKAVPPEMYEQQ